MTKGERLQGGNHAIGAYRDFNGGKNPVEDLTAALLVAIGGDSSPAATRLWDALLNYRTAKKEAA